MAIINPPHRMNKDGPKVHLKKWIHTFWAGVVALLALTILYVSISGLKIVETYIPLFTIRESDTLHCFSYKNSPFFFVNSKILPGDINALIFKGKYALSNHNELKDVRGQLTFNSLQQLYSASLQFETSQDIDFKITLDGVHQTEIIIQAIQNEEILWENSTQLQGPLLFVEIADAHSDENSEANHNDILDVKPENIHSDKSYKVLLPGGINLGIQAISSFLKEDADIQLSNDSINKSISISKKQSETECPLTPLDTIIPEAPTKIINNIKKLGYAP